MKSRIKITLGKSYSFLFMFDFTWIMKENLFLFSAKFNRAGSAITAKAVSGP